MVDELHALDVDSMTGPEVMELLVRATELRDAAEAVQLRAMAVVDAQDLHRADGAYSPASWLRSRSTLSRGQSLTLQRDAQMIRKDDLLSHALDTMGATKIRAMLRHVHRRNQAAFEASVATLLEQIAPLDTDDTNKVMSFWARCVDADGREPRSFDGNEATLSQTFNSTWHLSAAFDPVTGAELQAALAAEMEVIYRSLQAEEALPAHWTLRAMALMSLIRRALDPTQADTRVPPTVVVSVTVEDLAKATGHADLLGSGTRITAETARRLACDANIARLITDGPSDIVDYGRTQRTPPPRLRRALDIRDRGCVFPGCDRPPGHCKAHHILFWIRDHGPTSLWNLVLLCDHHHHLVHEGGWTLTRAPDGTLEFRRPNGRLFELPEYLL
jgi:hypothetical protein